ncbi:MAG: hypothetical protein LWW77_07420 [Propionibacteriales bacterium]|nr:hypothetical protein [Propionibacteriales bacterium]
MQVSSLMRRGVIVAVAAALGGATLIAAPTAAHAAPTFAVTGISASATTMTVPTTTTTYEFTLSFTGDAALDYEAYDHSYRGGTVTLIDGLDSSPSYLSVDEPTSPTPGQPAVYKLSLDQYTTPGTYRVSLPLSQWNGGSYLAEQVPTVDITVLANPAITLASSEYGGYGKYSKKSKWTWSYYGPRYVAGATVKVYYKASGKKKYVKVASGRANSSGDASFKGKKGAIRKKGTVYFLIGGVRYSPSVKSPAMKLVRV